jgi:DNA polymerase-3 subunit alpha
MKDFVHLHLHTQYSYLDGAIIIDRLIPKAKELGMKAIALTDHGQMFGMVAFYKACKDNGIKPIIGYEAYISPTDRFDREFTRQQNSNYHLILLAKDNVGFANLKKLTSIGYLEGMYYKPRIDKEMLAKYSAGIIGMSACLGGEIAQKILAQTYEEAKKAAIEYDRILGRGNYYLELQQNGIPEQDIVNPMLVKISEETGIPLVATCDCHYLDRGDDESHTILLCIQTKTTIDAPNRLETASAELYFKSQEEMVNAFKHFPPEAIENTVKIADMCNVTMEFGTNHLPVFEVPEGYTQTGYFTELAHEGLKKRLKNIPESEHKAYWDRLEYELETIVMKGYDGYYLIVWDFINFARESGIPVGPGRGSGAGSLAAYALKITDIDPIKMKLMFERFLNPERPSLPDFDVDFCVVRRNEVIEYVKNRYGAEKTAKILTLGELSGRSALKDVGRALKIPIAVMNKLSKLIPIKDASGSKVTLARALETNPSIRKEIEAEENGEELLRHTLKIEGLFRNPGVHAAGIAIADVPITEYVPLCKLGDEVVLQLEMSDLEKVGIVKFDFLGLANLTVIHDAVERIHRTVDPNFEINNIPYDDKEVYEMLTRGETVGVFQLESAGMRKLLKNLVPTSLDDLTPLNALYRPGPIKGGVLDEFCDRKHGRKQVSYPLPKLKDILKETYGIILYQEQIIQIAIELAGYSIGTADELRKAIGKKKKSLMEKHRKVFIEGDAEMRIPGTRKLGVEDRAATEIYSLIEKFGEYGFNKSHSAAYAVIAYQTAYLRAKYLPHFLCALMNNPTAKPEDRLKFIEDSRRMGIDVKKPDVNKSGINFEYEPPKNGEQSGKYSGGHIRFGLSGILNMGSLSAVEIVAEREKNGEFKNLINFCERVKSDVTNKKVLEALVYSGAFDCFGESRSSLLNAMDGTMAYGHASQKQKALGQRSIEDFLFGDDEEPEGRKPEEAKVEFPEHRLGIADFKLLMNEKRALSVYLSGHPLSAAHKFTNGFFPTTKDAAKHALGDKVMALGVITNLGRKQTAKKQQDMATFDLEDTKGTVPCVIFHKSYQLYKELLDTEDIYLLEGELSAANNSVRNIAVNSVIPFMKAIETYMRALKITLRETSSPEVLKDLYSILSTNRGDLTVQLEIVKGDGTCLTVNLADYKVKPSYQLFETLDNAKIDYDLISHRRKNADAALWEAAEESEESFTEVDNEEEFDDSGF